MLLTFGDTEISILILVFSSSNRGYKWFIDLSLSSQTSLALVCLRGQVTLRDELPGAVSATSPQSCQGALK